MKRFVALVITLVLLATTLCAFAEGTPDGAVPVTVLTETISAKEIKKASKIILILNGVDVSFFAGEKNAKEVTFRLNGHPDLVNLSKEWDEADTVLTVTASSSSEESIPTLGLTILLPPKTKLSSKKFEVVPTNSKGQIQIDGKWLDLENGSINDEKNSLSLYAYALYDDLKKNPESPFYDSNPIAFSEEISSNDLGSVKSLYAEVNGSFHDSYLSSAKKATVEGGIFLEKDFPFMYVQDGYLCLVTNQKGFFESIFPTSINYKKFELVVKDDGYFWSSMPIYKAPFPLCVTIESGTVVIDPVNAKQKIPLKCSVGNGSFCWLAQVTDGSELTALAGGVLKLKRGFQSTYKNATILVAKGGYVSEQ